MTAVGFLPGRSHRHSRREKPDMTEPSADDPHAHLKQRASERTDRTVERMKAGIAALQASGRKITAESIKEVTRELEPGFAGLSFQVIRRNARAYAIYREAADAFSGVLPTERRRRSRRRQRIRSPRKNPARPTTHCNVWTNGIWCGASVISSMIWYRAAPARGSRL